ncbi:hypothetical protein [Marinitoga sp. 1155]|uniref:hypothetical protein n=1 Tax=Marinitoga sp. 1155 TaxID=1428448 RepID=UPI0006412DB9|nr:hypothetical protein [Marinitoga sp. 1155]KLO23520.1 hypothetical protein X274_06445 [Marinitoga sp. 1155]
MKLKEYLYSELEGFFKERKELLNKIDIRKYSLNLSKILSIYNNNISSVELRFILVIYNYIIFEECNYSELVDDIVLLYEIIDLYVSIEDFDKFDIYKRAYLIITKLFVFVFNNKYNIEEEISPLFIEKSLINIKNDKKINNLIVEIDNNIIKNKINMLIKEDIRAILSTNSVLYDGYYDYFITLLFEKYNIKNNIDEFRENPSSVYYSSDSKYKEVVDGIRRIKNSYELIKLIPSNLLYLEDEDLFYYLFKENFLYTYNHQKHIETNLNIEIIYLFNEVDKNPLLEFNEGEKNLKMFLNTYLKILYLKIIYNFALNVKNNLYFKSNNYSFIFISNNIYETIEYEKISLNSFKDFLYSIVAENPKIFLNNPLSEEFDYKDIISKKLNESMKDTKKVCISVSYYDKEQELISFSKKYDNFKYLIFEINTNLKNDNFHFTLNKKNKISNLSDFIIETVKTIEKIIFNSEG